MNTRFLPVLESAFQSWLLWPLDVSFLALYEPISVQSFHAQHDPIPLVLCYTQDSLLYNACLFKKRSAHPLSSNLFSVLWEVERLHTYWMSSLVSVSCIRSWILTPPRDSAAWWPNACSNASLSNVPAIRLLQSWTLWGTWEHENVPMGEHKNNCCYKNLSGI